MLAMTGWRSRISQEVRRIAGEKYGETFERLTPMKPTLDAQRYLFCAGILYGKPARDLTASEIGALLDVNFVNVVETCEHILTANPYARICVVGSESGIAGSFDRLYAGSKAALHQYVETRRIRPAQQLVAVAPGIIGDAGMTLRRTDHENLAKREKEHPKGRFLSSAEVARLITFLLYEDSGYICNAVIRVNGGEHAR